MNNNEQKINELTNNIGSLQSNLDMLKDTVFYNMNVVWVVLGVITAAIGASLYIIVKQMVISKVDKEMEKIKSDLKESVFQFQEFPVTLVNGWKFQEKLTYSFDLLDNVLIHGLIDGGIISDGTVIGNIIKNISPTEDKTFGVFYEKGNEWYPCVLTINTKGQLIINGCRGNTILISNISYKQKYRKFM
ncbi:hypothetical protein ACT8ZR_18260 [Neobacillus sp. M.A.Huq-85]